MTTQAVQASRRRRGRRGHRRIDWWAYVFLLVPVTVILLIEVVPTFGVVWLSFTDYNPLDPDSWRTFIGLDNYTRLIHDPQAWQAFWQTLYFVLLYLPLCVGLGLGVALLLNQKVRGRTFFRGVYFLPVIASWVVGATMILWFVDPQSGGLALAMAKFGLGAPPPLLQESATALPTIAGVAIWKFVGYNAVLYLAALQTIDENLIESAKIDGAGAFARFRHITLPGLRPITAVVVILNLITALRLFDPIKVMTNGGPNFSSSTLVMYFYQVTWDGLQFGYGSAITIVLTLMILIGSGLQFLYFRYRGGGS
jgi:ABC-type sugar transport system permease subunit